MVRSPSQRRIGSVGFEVLFAIAPITLHLSAAVPHVGTAMAQMTKLALRPNEFAPHGKVVDEIIFDAYESWQ